VKKDIARLCRAAEKDLKITDGALRLFLRVVAVVDVSGPFPLTARAAGKLCGITDKRTLYARIRQLCPKYLKPLGIKGCPPTAWFEINL
jgi:hypothetical protein